MRGDPGLHCYSIVVFYLLFSTWKDSLPPGRKWTDELALTIETESVFLCTLIFLFLFFFYINNTITQQPIPRNDAL